MKEFIVELPSGITGIALGIIMSNYCFTGNNYILWLLIILPFLYIGLVGLTYIISDKTELEGGVLDQEIKSNIPEPEFNKTEEPRLPEGMIMYLINQPFDLYGLKLEQGKMLAIMETVGKDFKIFYEDNESLITDQRLTSLIELQMLTRLVEKSKMR